MPVHGSIFHFTVLHTLSIHVFNSSLNYYILFLFMLFILYYSLLPSMLFVGIVFILFLLSLLKTPLLAPCFNVLTTVKRFLVNPIQL